MISSPRVSPNVGGAGLDRISTATFRATCQAMLLSPKLAVERTEYPCKRTMAKAAMLKIANATMISNSVKPFLVEQVLTNDTDVSG